MKRSRKNQLLFYFIGFIIILILWGYQHIWRSPEFYSGDNSCMPDDRILTMQEYGPLADSHSRPYIISSENYLIFGSEHTNDPMDPQIELIESKWNQFNPSIALVEGRLGFLIPGIMNPVKYYWEMGKVKQLASKDKVPLYSWELPRDSLLRKKLDKGFSPEQVALSTILNSYFSNLRFGKPQSPENYVQNHIAKADIPELIGVIKSVDQIDSIWQRDFSDERDWRDTSDQWGLPGYLQEIADITNQIRNEHLVCIIEDLLHKGERPFVIAGSSHAVCMQSIFKSNS